MKRDRRNALLRAAVAKIASRCPRLERVEARDLADIAAVLQRHPTMERTVRRAVAGQDALLLAERLLGWTDVAIREDLRAYEDLDPRDAVAMRDRLLEIVKRGARR